MMRIALIALVLAAGVAHAQEAREGGYWKFHEPAVNKPFGNDDVVALAQGHHVKTDCSVPWIGGDGNTYCFKDIASRETFLHAPMDYYRQALNVLAREHGDQPQGSRAPLENPETREVSAHATQEKPRC
jgi:hypothetical protein